ncbi:MAG: CAP domain-containing protein [Gemmatimonadaceae bacterium]
MNQARANPRRYAEVIESTLSLYEGTLLRRPGETPVRTREGAAAVREAARVLRSIKAVPPLVASRGMSMAARDLVHDQSRAGSTGHTGSDGSSPADRVARYGRWDVSLSENIAYGPTSARDIVVQLIVDDDVPDRAHRTNIFDPVARVAGVACGTHATYDRMCVIDYAGLYAEAR